MKQEEKPIGVVVINCMPVKQTETNKLKFERRTNMYF